MSTRIFTDGPKSRIAATPTAPRVTPAPAQPFKAFVQTGASAVVDGANAALQRLPGGPLLAAAVRNGSTTNTSSVGTSAEGPHSASAVTGSPSEPLAAGAASTNLGDPQTLGDSMLRQSHDTLYYLQLQEQISAESRAYSTLSNVLKAKHDTVKNAINNIR